MKHLGLNLCVSLTLMSWAAQGRAQHMIGGGVDSCGTWTFERQPPLRALQDQQWVLGYLSAAGQISSAAGGGADPLKDMDAQGVWAWVDNYCKANPIKRVWEASMAFILAHPR